MTIITLYALFADDIRQLFFTKAADKYFSGITCGVMFFFALEIVLSSLAKEDYFLGFYFWLDVVASASLIFDIGWAYDAMLGQQQLTASNAKQTNSLARATKGARIGTKAGRIARVIRLIRLIRIVKLYKSANSVLEKEEAQALEEN